MSDQIKQIDKEELKRCCNAIFELFETRNISQYVAASAMSHILDVLKKDGITPFKLSSEEIQ